MAKRLFIFAAYDKDSIVDNTLLYYLGALSKLGDIIFTMDCDAPSDELAKVTEIPNVIHATAMRHGEYDFGSYKRGYQYARDNKLLNKYDWIYLVNDSVYGPLWDLKPILEDLESRGVDLTGIASYVSHKFPLHIQSWFVGISRTIATSEFFKTFISDIKSEQDKEILVLKYEVRLSRLIMEHGYKLSAFVTLDGNIDYDLYRKPLDVLSDGVPFVKKLGLNKLPTIYFLCPHTTPDFFEKIYTHAVRVNLLKSETPAKTTGYNYHKIMRINFIGLPIIEIFRKTTCANIQYKVYLLRYFPILKFVTSNP